MYAHYVHLILILASFSVMPIPLTIAWLVTKMYEDGGDSKSCGYGYTFLWSYWILEGPRIAAVTVRQSSFIIPFRYDFVFKMNKRFRYT